MKRYFLLCLMGGFFLISLPGQPSRDFIFFNDTTHMLYEAAEWEALIFLSNEALSSDIDYYYLRLRLGIAYYEKGQYQRAVRQFYKALQFNRWDQLAEEYLYYSLFKSGRPDEARLFAGTFNTDDALASHPWPLAIFGNATHKWSDDQTPVGELEDFSLGLRHGLVKGLTYSHTYEYLRQYFSEEAAGEIPGNNGQQPWASENNYYFDQQYYRGQAIWQLKHGWQLGATFNLAWIEGRYGSFQEQYYFGYVIKQFPGFECALGLGHSDFQDAHQRQLQLAVGYYPLYNTDVYVKSVALLQEASDGEELEYLADLQLGIRLAPNIWLEGKGGMGKIAYFQEAYGNVIYNIPDRMRWRCGGHFAYWMNGHSPLFVAVQLEEKEYSQSGATYRHMSLTAGLLLNLW